MVHARRFRTEPFLPVALGLVFSLLFPIAASAQLVVGGGLLDECAKIDSLRKKGNIPAARDAATKCLEGLEQELDG